MRLQNCQHPIRVYNKYIDEYVWVACGKCSTCLKRKQGRWTARLENERKSSLFVLFVTLTYDDKHLPRLVRYDEVVDSHKVETYRAYDDKFRIPFTELKFDTTADLDYFNNKMHAGGVPYADFADVQKFNKRLNKRFHDKYTNTYENFRYFVCSELGKESLRPHYHGLYFFRKEIETSNFAEDILACWHDDAGNTIGNIEVEYVESTAAAYVSKYIGKPAYYPSFYSHSKIYPRFICSKNPPIGSNYELQQSSAEIFHTAAISVVLPNDSQQSLMDVPLPSYCKNRLFPKCPQFSRISHALRVAVYRCSSRFLAAGFQGNWKSNYSELVPVSFDGFLHTIRLRCCAFGSGGSSFDEYIRKLVDPYTETGVNTLRRLYYMSKRVLKYCKQFHVTVEYYVTKIEEFYNKVELKILSQFYEFQQKFVETNPVEQLENMYSEFAFNNFGIFRDLRFCLTQLDPIPLKECFDYQSMCKDDDLSYNLSCWKHLYNASSDVQRCSDTISKKLTLNFYYAKECYEIAKAIA